MRMAPRRSHKSLVEIAYQHFFHCVPGIIGPEKILNILGTKDLESFL